MAVMHRCSSGWEGMETSRYNPTLNGLVTAGWGHACTQLWFLLLLSLNCAYDRSPLDKGRAGLLGRGLSAAQPQKVVLTARGL